MTKEQLAEKEIQEMARAIAEKMGWRPHSPLWFAVAQELATDAHTAAAKVREGAGFVVVEKPIAVGALDSPRLLSRGQLGIS